MLNEKTTAAGVGGLQSDFKRFVELATAAPQAGEDLSLRTWMGLAEAWRIMQVLERCRGNRSAAARALGIGRRTLYAKMEKLGIAPTWRATLDPDPETPEAGGPVSLS